MRFTIFALLSLAIVGFSTTRLRSQTPVPVLVQTQAAEPAADNGLAQSFALLEKVKATNAETIKKQQSTFDVVDELQKAAEQIKIYSKRG